MNERRRSCGENDATLAWSARFFKTWSTAWSVKRWIVILPLFINVAEQRAAITATGNKPVFQGVGGTVGGIPEPVFSSFGTTDCHFAGFDVVVGKIQADTL